MRSTWPGYRADGILFASLDPGLRRDDACGDSADGILFASLDPGLRRDDACGVTFK